MVKESDVELIAEASSLDKAAAIYLVTRLNKPVEKWDAYRLGLIDRSGNVVREPETRSERQAFGTLEKIVLLIRRNLPRSVLSALSAYSVWKILSEEQELPGLDNVNDRMLKVFYEVLNQAETEGINEREALRWLRDQAEILNE